MELEVSSSCQKRKLETETQKQEVRDAANLKKPKLDDTDRELADAEKINASWPEEKESQIACSGENGQCKKLKRDKIKTLKPEEEKEDRWVASSDEHKQKEEEKNDSWNVSGDENKEEKAENMSTEDNQLDSAAELRENKGKGYAFKDTRTESSQQDRSSKLEYILRCNLQVKQSGGLISLEAFYLDGSSGKDGLNQMLQFMRNKLTNPDI